MTTLPRLELAETDSPFDEAVILIDGREEETIRIECTGARELAERLLVAIENHENAVALLIRLYAEGTLSEGQVSRATGLDRVTLRAMADALPTEPA
jgi:hypothetical protein